MKVKDVPLGKTVVVLNCDELLVGILSTFVSGNLHVHGDDGTWAVWGDDDVVVVPMPWDFE